MRTYCSVEIQDALRAAQVGTTRNTLKPICILCRRFLSRWDVRIGREVCWRCRKNFARNHG